MAQAAKPYIDRLIALNHLLNPIDRLVAKHEQIQQFQSSSDRPVAKREQVQQFQSEVAEDIAEIEDLASDFGTEIDEGLFNDLQGEIAAVKKDCKLFVSQAAVAADDATQSKGSDKKRALGNLPLPERFKRIFGSRYIDLPQLETLLGFGFSPDQRADFYGELEGVRNWLLSRNALRPHIDRNRIKTLQATFGDYALPLRSPLIADTAGQTAPCSLEALRNRFPDFFVGIEKGMWYTNMPFYRQPIKKWQWVLLDRQYLNCTFKKPTIRLLIYARANDLSAKQVRQKSATEDIYDRILLELALKERFVDNCHSITSTIYHRNAKTSARQVYTYYKDNAIRISGKSGLPHWRPSKPRWPGVLPSLVISRQQQLSIINQLLDIIIVII